MYCGISESVGMDDSWECLPFYYCVIAQAAICYSVLQDLPLLR